MDRMVKLVFVILLLFCHIVITFYEECSLNTCKNMHGFYYVDAISSRIFLTFRTGLLRISFNKLSVTKGDSKLCFITEKGCKMP